MKNILSTLLSPLLFLLLLTLLSACGDTTKQPAAATTIKAVIKTTALTANKNIAGIDLTISLPLGVSPPLLADGKADPAATVVITSSAPAAQTLPGANYTPATAAATGKLAITAIAAAGFSATDQITLKLNVAAGTVPIESDFTLLSFTAFDINGAPVSGLSPTLTATIY
jgi:hypothetical protein